LKNAKANSALTADYAFEVQNGAYFKGVIDDLFLNKNYNIGDIVIYKSSSNLGTTSDDGLGDTTSDDSFGDTNTTYIMTENGWEEIGSSVAQEIYAFKEDTEKTYLVGIKNADGDSTIDTLKYSSKIYASNGNLYAESDERYKNFYNDIECNLEDLVKLPKKYFKYKGSEIMQIGTSAQALKEQYPELVSEDENGKLAVSYEKLSIVALAAVDKLYEENKMLKERLSKIEEYLGL
jgi:hypothetical protein